MRTIDWVPADGGPGHIRLVDQTLLPGTLTELDIRTVDELVDAISRLAVRGAPALGVAGAMGVALAVQTLPAEHVPAAVARLRAARPTAANLAVGVDKAWAQARGGGGSAALAAALAMRDEDIAGCREMARRGAELLGRLVPDRPRLTALTICNTGALAAVEHGTALSVVERLHEEDRLERAVVCETRPLLQGARLTAWELSRMGARYELIVDSAAASILAAGEVHAVLVGADRIAANGDTANKIGTFALALAAVHAGVPFLVVAPETTVDLATPSGFEIEIEDRGADEVRAFRGVPSAPADAPVRNPAFDVTPADLITAIVTDRRVVDLAEHRDRSTRPAYLGPSLNEEEA
ncbi:MAG TPA: S-methyl-5-thioribose-1-phosphate isomerase [Pseudonocardia sp.]|nr:S-methyl-5-thioribose-1-phosphate isomerase [Pseudonocardia sp.]